MSQPRETISDFEKKIVLESYSSQKCSGHNIIFFTNRKCPLKSSLGLNYNGFFFHTNRKFPLKSSLSLNHNVFFSQIETLSLWSPNLSHIFFSFFFHTSRK